MVGIVERVSQDVSAEIGSIGRSCRVIQVHRPRHVFARVGVDGAPVAHAVLDRQHLHVVPVLPERTQHSTVVGHVPIPVGRAFPRNHGCEVRRVEPGNEPRVDREIGHPRQTNLARAPWLDSGPLDCFVEIVDFLGREMVQVARRAAGAAHRPRSA